MNIIVNGEEPFQAPASRLCIGKTSAGYTLQYGADKDSMTDWSEATDAGTDVVVSNAVPGMWMRLSGNTDSGVVIVYSL